jgi:hypothetical protein
MKLDPASRPGWHLSWWVIPLLLWQCGFQPKKPESTSYEFPASGALIADTILYPVTIINPDSTDTWTDQRLKRLDRATFINQLFEALYSQTLIAYNYYTNQPIPIKTIQEMEASGELNRQDVAQLQFEESWFFNASAGSLSKKVHSILLAIPVFNDQKEIKGYKAAFVVKLNP